jgi:hypothetical protein
VHKAASSPIPTRSSPLPSGFVAYAGGLLVKQETDWLVLLLRLLLLLGLLLPLLLLLLLLDLLLALLLDNIAGISLQSTIQEFRNWSVCISPCFSHSRVTCKYRLKRRPAQVLSTFAWSVDQRKFCPPFLFCFFLTFFSRFFLTILLLSVLLLLVPFGNSAGGHTSKFLQGGGKKQSRGQTLGKRRVGIIGQGWKETLP